MKTGVNALMGAATRARGISAAKWHRFIGFPLLYNQDAQVARSVMTKAGDWSYGIYLWHVPLVLVLLVPLRVLERARGWNLIGTPVFDLLFYPSLFIIAALGYRHIELPSKRMIKELSVSTLR